MLSELQKILVISFYTAKEVIKSKVLINTLFLGIALFVLTFVAYNFTYGEPARIALDFGLGTLSLSTVAISIFIGVGIISNEIDNRTVYLIISRPISRSSFILGKILGLSSVLSLNVIILSIITLSLYFFIGGKYSSLISWSILFIGVEAILMLLVVTVFALLSSRVLSVIMALGVYIVGHAIDGVKLLSFVQERSFMQKILEIYHFVLPGFYRFNIKEFVLYKQDIEISYLLGSLGYGVLYGLALVILSIIIFEKKSLD